MKSLSKPPACALPARAAFSILGLTLAMSAAAAPQPPLAPTTSNGFYTVTAQACNPDASLSCMDQTIEERVEPNGSWQQVSGNFVAKPSGTYRYRVVEIYCDVWYGYCYEDYSSTVTVSVTAGDLPLPEPLDQQLSYRYSVRHGNVVGDSGTDLLIERTSGPEEGNGVIDALILQQVAGAGFRAVVPSAAQRASSIWQSSTLPVSVEDMNADGYVDIALRNIASIVPGASDQIAFASGNGHVAQPKGLRAFDASLEGFTANLIDYMADKSYFSRNAGVAVLSINYPVQYCPGSGLIDSWGMADMLHCVSVSLPNYYLIPDYSGFDSDAVDIWQDETAVANGDLTPGQAADRIAGRIEDVLDVAIGGWDMREIFGAGSGIDDPAERRGLESFLAILGIGNARADEVDPDEAPSQGPRDNDIIHIVSRYVFGASDSTMHTALLYRMPGTGLPTWYSAFDSDDRALFDGKLIAKTSDPKDSPLLMRMTLGEVLPPVPQSRFVYFFTDLQSAHEHYKDLPASNVPDYDAIPELPCGGCNGRNSNGYVNGLIRATNAQALSIAGFDFDKLFGWEFPVEAHYFGR